MTGFTPLRLELSPSGTFAAAILALHATAAACVVLVLRAAPGVALAGLLLALGAAAAWDRALLRGPSAPRAIEIHSSGQAFLLLGNGAALPIGPVGGFGVTRFLVALRTEAPTRRSALVARDMLGREPFRLLRLWARWGKLPGVAPGQRPA